MLHLVLFRFVTTLPFVQQVTKNRATNQLKVPASWAGELGWSVNLRLNAGKDEVCFCAAVHTRTLQSRDVDSKGWHCICFKALMHSVVVFPFISETGQVGSSCTAAYL